MALTQTKHIEKLGNTVRKHICYRRSMINVCVLILMYIEDVSGIPEISKGCLHS